MPVLVNPSRFTVAAPTSYSGSVLARPSLIGYWRQSETSGTTMGDASPGGHAGIYRTTKTSVTSLLTGDSDSASTAAGDVAGSFLNVTDITLECIIKTPASIAGTLGILSRFGSGAHCWLIWMDTSSKIAVRFYNTSGSQVDIAWSTTPSVNTKYHLAATYTSGHAELFVNGASVGSSTSLTGNLATGVQDVETLAFNGGSFGYPGVGDEFALYSTALSSAEIAADAALV